MLGKKEKDAEPARRRGSVLVIPNAMEWHAGDLAKGVELAPTCDSATLAGAWGEPHRQLPGHTGKTRLKGEETDKEEAR